jgi:hypothetical protein
MFGSKRRRVIEAEVNLGVKREQATLATQNYIAHLEKVVSAMEDALSAKDKVIAAQERIIAILKRNVPPDFLAAAQQEIERLKAPQTPE